MANGLRRAPREAGVSAPASLPPDEGDFTSEDGPAVKTEVPFIPTSPAPTGLTPEMIDLIAKVTQAVVGSTPHPAGLSEDALTRIVEASGSSMRKALKPENPVSPEISVFNPLGERDHPRPPLARPDDQGVMRDYFVMMGTYPMDWASLTREEIELLNQLQAGEFLVTKADGSLAKLTVRLDVTESGAVQRMQLLIPASGDDHKSNWPPLVSLLREALGMAVPSSKEVADLRAEIARLTKLAAA